MCTRPKLPICGPKLARAAGPRARRPHSLTSRFALTPGLLASWLAVYASTEEKLKAPPLGRAAWVPTLAAPQMSPSVFLAVTSWDSQLSSQTLGAQHCAQNMVHTQQTLPAVISKRVGWSRLTQNPTCCSGFLWPPLNLSCLLFKRKLCDPSLSELWLYSGGWGFQPLCWKEWHSNVGGKVSRGFCTGYGKSKKCSSGFLVLCNETPQDSES